MTGCSIRHTFQCERDDQCGSAAMATCQPTGYCSFADGNCSSGWRYDDLAAASYAGKCVGDGAGADAGADSDGACWPYTATNLDPCALGTPAPALDLTMTANSYELDTGNGQWKVEDISIAGPPGSTRTQASGTNVRVLELLGFSLASGANLTIKGPLPLVIIVHGSSTIAGTITVEAGRATASQCGNGISGTGAITASGGGGGGGGGFGTDGAGGGNGGGGRTGGGLGATSGIASLSPLRGGCDGGQGGPSAVGDTAGRGNGGGGFEMIVRDALVVSGRIEAPGRGGNGGPTNVNGGGGGAGGGAGGAVFLEAADLTIEATGDVCANGGAGGEGGSTTLVGAGGNDGMCTTPATSPNATTGGDGGSGATATTAAGVGATGGVADAGGGGGGGGVGRIRLRGVSTRMIKAGATISPAAVP